MVKDRRIEISNNVNMLEGCKNRMCVTDDAEELVRLYGGLIRYATALFELNCERICDKEDDDQC